VRTKQRARPARMVLKKTGCAVLASWLPPASRLLLRLLLGEEEALALQAGLAPLRSRVVLLLLLGVELRRAFAHALYTLRDSVHLLPHFEQSLRVHRDMRECLNTKKN
jgi:hypothetical protein